MVVICPQKATLSEMLEKLTREGEDMPARIRLSANLSGPL